MKILFVSYSDADGGAFIAAKRLFDAMLAAKIDVYMGVVEKKTNCDRIFELPKNKNFEKQNAKRSKKNLLQTTNTILHSISKLSKIDINYINQSDFDIVHLHWVAFSTISIEDIAKIQKPIVWTMHDSWLFCGAEHHPNVLENDTRFIEGYTEENFPQTSSGVDICRITWERKKKAWKNKKFHFVALCNRHGNCLTDSALFKGEQATVIPSPIPKEFRPISITAKKMLKQILNIPLNKQIIGFGAVNVNSSNKTSVKGEIFLLNAIKKIKEKQNCFMVIFGAMDDKFSQMLPIKSVSAGKIFDANLLNAVYNCLDCFVAPSLIETFCNTAHEAMHCGVPVCGFDVLGISECVAHKQTGYLARPFNTGDLARGIEFCLVNQKELSKNSIARAKDDYFNEKYIVKKHIEVYKTSLTEVL